MVVFQGFIVVFSSCSRSHKEYQIETSINSLLMCEKFDVKLKVLYLDWWLKQSMCFCNPIKPFSYICCNFQCYYCTHCVLFDYLLVLKAFNVLKHASKNKTSLVVEEYDQHLLVTLLVKSPNIWTQTIEKIFLLWHLTLMSHCGELQILSRKPISFWFKVMNYHCIVK